jgi:hypothetical protein
MLSVQSNALAVCWQEIGVFCHVMKGGWGRAWVFQRRIASGEVDLLNFHRVFVALEFLMIQM